MKSTMMIIGALLALTANASLNTGMHSALTQGITVPQIVTYVSGILRGSITGYMKGMYSKTTYVPDPECFGNDTQANIVTIFTSWDTPSFDVGNDIVSLQ